MAKIPVNLMHRAAKAPAAVVQAAAVIPEPREAPTDIRKGKPDERLAWLEQRLARLGRVLIAIGMRDNDMHLVEMVKSALDDDDDDDVDAAVAE